MTPPASSLSGAPTPREEASRWIIRQDMGELSPEDAIAFEAWLREPANAAAYLLAQKSWNVFERGAGDPQLLAMRETALATGPGSRRRTWLQIAIAATVLAFIFGGAALFWMEDRSPSSSQTAATAPADRLDQLGAPDYSTQTGQRLDVVLPDGSAVTLNTDTELDVGFSPGQRLVRLRKGQAFFRVAKDPSRPFIVLAANRRVQAIGTAFDVQIAPEQFRVVLAEGEVRIEQDKLTASAGTAPAVKLTAGQALIAALGVPEQVMPVNVDRALRWRQGIVEFDDERLGAAVAEMNRYARQPALIRDERVAGLHISGVFRTDQPDRFLKVASELLPVDVQRTPDSPPELTWREKR